MTQEKEYRGKCDICQKEMKEGEKAFRFVVEAGGVDEEGTFDETIGEWETEESPLELVVCESCGRTLKGLFPVA